MGIFTKLFKKNTEEVSSKNVEDFVLLTRVYFQSVIAANLVSPTFALCPM